MVNGQNISVAVQNMTLLAMKNRYVRSMMQLGMVMLGLASFNSQAKLIEEIIKVPVKVSDFYGKVIERDVVVTVFYDDAQPKPYPVAIINHGRAVKPEERAAFGRSTSITNARWLASLGYMVASPTRIGYGVTGGEDVEDSGACQVKNYPPAYKAGADQTIQILSALRQRLDVLPDKGLIFGQSMGGTIAISSAAQNPPGIQATINFAGGGGGNPDINPGEPCRPDSLERMFANYGKTAKIPTLWVYTDNDKWMGTKYPKQWFAAFKASGGVGEYLALPANGADGHGVFTRDPAAWRPQVTDYLRGLGVLK